MPLTAYGKNTAIAAIAAKTNPTVGMGFIGLFSSIHTALTAGTLVGASLINMTGSKAAGWVNNKPVVFRTLNAGVTGLVAGRIYFIVGEVANGFEVATEEGGAAVKVSGAELTAAGTEVALLTEITGGTYTRVAAAWGAALNGEISLSNTPELKVPAGKEITDAGFWPEVATGKLLAQAKLEIAEPFGAEGTYKVTAEKLEANPASVA